MICILLSTFNGEKYLAEQLDSLLGQTCQEWMLLVRDDGSTDGTRKILAEYACRDSRIELLPHNQRLGAADSYLELLSLAPEADYYAFCDQDDVWLPGKLSRSVQRLVGHEAMPALYCSGLQLVDDELRPLGWSRALRLEPCFLNSLVENIAIGCTLVLNRQACQLLRLRIPPRRQIYMHDWWCYQVISAFGLVIYDPESFILYRQHAANTLGGLQGFALWRRRLLQFKKRRKSSQRFLQLNALHHCWSQELAPYFLINLEKIRTLMQEKNILHRLILLGKTPVRRQNVLDTFFCRLLLLARRYQ